jgi:hypothetical protein
VTARWILVAAGLLLALWNPGPIEQLRLQLGAILLLGVANFYLHAQLLTKRPTVAAVAYATSAADVLFISLLILTQGGLQSDLYTFYMPAILAFSLSFPTLVTLGFAGGAVAIYGLIGFLSLLYISPYGAIGLGTEGERQTLVVRLLMIAAVAVCGNVYWRIERKRRRVDEDVRERLRVQLAAAGARPGVG